MERVKKNLQRLTIIFVNTISDFIRLGRTSPPLKVVRVFGNSIYTFHKVSPWQKRSWMESRQRCKATGSDLVSIESKKEWSFLKRTIQRMNTIEYFIGLENDTKSGEWKWISDNSTVNSTKGESPWAKDEPSGDGNCAVIYKDYLYDYGLFNDLPCDTQQMDSGYICESPIKSTDQEGMSYKLLRVKLYAFHYDFTGHSFFFFLFK